MHVGTQLFSTSDSDLEYLARHGVFNKNEARIRAGLAARKAKGRRLGRAPLPMKTVSQAQRLRETGLSYAEIGKALKISKGSAFNACKQETGA